MLATLPGGYWRTGLRYQEAELRPVVGEDEAFLLETGDRLTPAERATNLLARCLTRLGPPGPVSLEAVRLLTVGDREALLLHLRRATVGDRVLCTIRCPHPGCGERLEMELTVGHLLVPPYPEARPRYEHLLADGGAAYRVRFRLPTGADQEAAAPLAGEDPQAAARLVLQRCVDEVISVDDEEEQPVETLPASVVRTLPRVMADLDPQAEVRLTLTCPSCEASLSVLFDTMDYFCHEIASPRSDLYREVHALALHYHWSQAEIMAMTRPQRQRYLGLLAETLGEGARRERVPR